jgi:hypothetical protein
VVTKGIEVLRSGTPKLVRTEVLPELAKLRGYDAPVFLRNPDGYVAKGAFVPCSVEPFGHRLLVRVSASVDAAGYAWAAEEFLTEYFGERSIFRVNQLPVLTMLPTANVWLSGKTIMQYAQFVGGGYQIHVDTPHEWGAIISASGALGVAFGKTAPTLAQLDPISVTAACPSGLVVRPETPPAVRELLIRCSLEPSCPISLLDARMEFRAGRWVATYKLGERSTSAVAETERAAWEAAATAMNKAMKKWSPPQLNGTTYDLATEMAVAPGVVRDLLGVLPKHGVYQDPAMGIRHTVRVPLPVGRMELSAFAPKESEALMGTLYHRLGEMIRLHGFRPFLAG